MAKRTKAAGPAAAPAVAPLVLPSELTIYTVGEQHPLWLNWLGGLPTGSPVVAAVDAGAVDQLDAAGVQLLLSLGHAVEQAGARLELARANDVVRQACAALGLSAWLQQHSAAAAAGARA